MEDIEKACQVLNTTAGEIGMTEEDRGRANELLKAYGEKREGLFKKMLWLLEEEDVSSLDSEWKDCCSNGKEALSNLNDAVPPTDGEGLTGIGLDSFYRGELKIWDENAKAGIASAAGIISKIYSADIALIAKCDEDLKTVRDGDKVVEALVEQNIGGFSSSVKDFLTLLLAKTPQVLNPWLKDGTAKTYVREWAQLIRTYLEENLKAAKQKRVFKETINDNIELISKTKEQLSEEWIDAMYSKGLEFAKSLPGIGSSNDYGAADWAEFGESCTKTLADRRDRAKEQSKKIFDELLPTFLEENNRAFAALTDDPSVLDAWKKDMKDDFTSIDEVLAKQNGIISALAEGPYKQAVAETLRDIKSLITSASEASFSSTEDAQNIIEK